MSARTALVFTGAMSLFFAGAAQAHSSAGENSTSSAIAPATLVVAAFQRGVPAAPKYDAAFDAGAHVEQGFDMIRRGKQAQAVKLFDKVIDHADRQLYGDTRSRLCRVAGPVDASVSVDPAVCDAHFGKGFALIDMGRGDLAEAELRQATQMAPGNAHFANEYAELFKSRRDWQHSYESFAKAWSVVDKATTGPDAGIAARALRGMGFNKAAMGQYDEAQSLYTQSLQYDPKSEIAQAELGNIARRKAIGS